MSDTKLKLEKVNITLDSKVVLDNVNLEVSDGDIVSLMGSSASGKTSLIRSIAGFHNITSGSIYIDEKIVDDSKKGGCLKEILVLYFKILLYFPSDCEGKYLLWSEYNYQKNNSLIEQKN